MPYWHSQSVERERTMKFKAILFALIVSLGVSASATASTVTPVPGEAHVQNIG